MLSPPQSKEESFKSRCRLACSWKRASVHCLLQAWRRHKVRVIFSLARRGRKVNFRRQKQQFFIEQDDLFKASTASLALELLAHEEWRRYGNYNYQKLRSECTRSAIVQTRTMVRQRIMGVYLPSNSSYDNKKWHLRARLHLLFANVQKVVSQNTFLREFEAWSRLSRTGKHPDKALQL